MRNLKFIILTTIILATLKTMANDIADMNEHNFSSHASMQVSNDETRTSLSDLPDSLFYHLSGSVIFPVNRTELNLNDPFMQDLAQNILPYLRTHNWRLHAINMRGAASPEGPYLNNVRLSRERAAALASFVCHELGHSYTDTILIHTVAEDYDYLIRMMEDAGDADAALVQKIFDAAGHDEQRTKQRLMDVNNGRLWDRLLATYFPKLRAARAVFVFRQNDDPVGATIEGISLEMPQLDLLGQIDQAQNLIDLTDTRRLIPRRHVLSVSTNLLYDVFYMPNFGWAPAWNIGLEYYPSHGKFTFAAEFTSPYYHRWKKHKFFQLRDYHLEARRYFKPGAMHTGFFVGLAANFNLYGIGLNGKKGWQGEGLGGTLKGGYVMRLGNSGRWRLEFTAGMGIYYTRFDPYVYGNPVTGADDGDYYYKFLGNPAKFLKRNHQRFWLGPTEVGITLRYDLLFHRYRKGGVSFKQFEPAMF